jgi:hypothetical protein
LGLLAAWIAALTIQAAGGDAIAAETHVLDQALSLTGNCSTSALDEIPDPGTCPMPPGVPGVDHPSAPFQAPAGIAVDAYGNIYVSSPGPQGAGEGRIDVFDSEGSFITEIEDPEEPRALAVDSQGTLYVIHYGEDYEYGVVRYEPVGVYEPEAGQIEYGAWVGVATDDAQHTVAVDPVTDQLFVKSGYTVTKYKSAAEGNEKIEEFGFPVVETRVPETRGIVVDSARDRLYIGAIPDQDGMQHIYALELAAPHAVLFAIDGSAVPGGFRNPLGLSLAVDEGTGHLFAYDATANMVYEFDQNGTYVSTIQQTTPGHGFEGLDGSYIAVDNGAHSPNGAEDPDGRYLFVPSTRTGVGHVFAFEPKPEPKVPVVESVGVKGITEEEAVLTSTINPKAAQTTYRFEYTTEQSFEAEGFASASLGREGTLAPLNQGIALSAPIVGLSPGTAYRFRVVAENQAGGAEEQGRFRTYTLQNRSADCLNEPLRTGLSASLPDCRAYELVSPANTNGHTLYGSRNVGDEFWGRRASPEGGKVSFLTTGGAIPGFEGSSERLGDPYLSIRGDAGWTTEATGPSAAEARVVKAGSPSPDQGFSFWRTDTAGSAAVEGKSTAYVRYPDGRTELIGRGSVDSDPHATGKLISENGSHIIFLSGAAYPAVQLEPDAPPSGTWAIYDRTSDEVTHVVSLLPDDETPAAGEDALYKGASLDGRGIAFALGPRLYLRYDDEETYEVGENITFEGVAEGGARLFYLKGGDLYRFDAQANETTRFSEVGDTVPVNISADGSAAYFVSKSAIPTGANPYGDSPITGAENLYLSREGAISFLGTVTEGDVEGVAGNNRTGGLGLWNPNAPAVDPSRSTATGSVLLFESTADLTGFDPEGHREIYRYDAGRPTLACLSCNPTGGPTSGDASLQSVSSGVDSPEPLNGSDSAVNLSNTGNRAVFQSPEALVAADVDGVQDVYEWEEEGEGSCKEQDGCVYLISSGQSGANNYLYGMSDSGRDVFFRTSDLLLPADSEETPSIYDARVEGGFPAAAEIAGECLGEACQPAVSPPRPVTPASAAFHGPGNVTAGTGKRPCHKGKRRGGRRAKIRCAKHHRHHRKVHRGKRSSR